MENKGQEAKQGFNENKNQFEKIRVNGMEIIIADNYEQMSRIGADMMYDAIQAKPDLLMCTATGSTPTKAYDMLAEKKKGFDEMRMIKLDEWGGIPSDDPATCETYLQKHLVEPMGISPDRFISFESQPENPEQEVKRVSAALEQEGDIDLCILGMGVNGHLGFNEPAEYLHPGAHIAKLAETTKEHTMAKEAEHEIKYGLTLGMNAIMHSKKIILMVNGEAKREVFKKFLSGEITSGFPASMLSMHPNITIICDREVVPDTSGINKD